MLEIQGALDKGPTPVELRGQTLNWFTKRGASEREGPDSELKSGVTGAALAGLFVRKAFELIPH